MISFSKALIPFQPEAGMEVRASVEVANHLIRLVYTLTGDLSSLIVPEAIGSRARKGGLWEHTCFEAFLKRDGGSEYFEANLAPSGNWELFHFDGPRRGRVRVKCGEPLGRFSREKTQSGIQVEWEWGYSNFFPGGNWSVGLTTVLEHLGGRHSYWALRHSSDRPDFHCFDSFLARLNL